MVEITETDLEQIAKQIKEGYTSGRLDCENEKKISWSFNTEVWTDENLDDRWSVEVSLNPEYISILDHENKKGIFLQDESAKELLDKAEELGANNTFIDWLYDNGYESSFSDYHYHNGKP
jgi:hypothetical protein